RLRLRGSFKGVPIIVEFHAGSKHASSYTSITAQGDLGFSMQPAVRLFKGGLETGDLEFDRTFLLEGPSELVIATLPADVRKELRILGSGVSIQNGDLRFRFTGEP